MRITVFTALLISMLLMGAGVQTSPVDAAETTDLGFTIHTLQNGMRVVLREVPAYTAVHFNTWIRVGSRNERPDEYGIAHFLEHMIFNGNSRYSLEEMNDALYSIGAYDNASTSYDYTHYRTTLPAEHFDLGLDIHCHMIMEPNLSEATFFPEREVVKEEARMRQDRPTTRVWETCFNSAFDHTGYIHPIIGYPEVIDEMDVGMMRDFHRRFYYPGNMILIVAGDFNTDDALSKINEAFGKYENPVVRGREPRNLPDMQTEPRIFILTDDISGCYLDAVYKAPPMVSDETYALDILMTILGDGDSARIPKRLKGELGIAGDAGAYNYGLFDGSSLGISIEYANPADSETVLAEVISIIEDFKINGPTPLELEKAKRKIITSQVMSAENLDGMCRYLGSMILRGGVEMVTEYLDKINSVTSGQVVELANRYLSRDNLTIALLRPEKSRDIELNADGLSEYCVTRADFGFGEITTPLPFKMSGGSSKETGVRHETLPNGLEIWYMHNPANATVAINLYVEGGLAWENKETNGACRVLQNSLLQGTTSRTREEIFEELDYLGGTIEVDAYRDFLAFESMFLSADIERGFHLVADIIGYPALDSEGINKAREEVIGMVTAEDNNMFRVAFDTLRNEIYGDDHPYGRPYKGSLESLENIDADDIRALYREAYQPRNMHLVIVGDVEFEDVADAIDAYFAGKPAGNSSPPGLPAITGIPRPIEKVVPREKNQVMITIGRPTVDRFSDDYPSLLLMNVILGGSSYSRLYDEIREKRGMAYSVSSFQQAGCSPALWACYLGTKPENYPGVIDIIYDVIEDMKVNGITPDELRKGKDYFIGREYLRHIGNKALASYIGQNVVVGLEPDHELKQLDNIANLTMDDIIGAARRYLDADAMAVVVVGKV